MSKFIKLTSLILIFFFFSTFTPSYKGNNKSIIFPIKKILIEGNNVVDQKTIALKLQNINGKSLMFFNKNYIKQTIFNYDFISSVKVKKIYPSTIKFIIFEKKPIAIFINDKGKFYISENGDLLNYVFIQSFKNLPTIFNYDKSFINLHETLKKIDFPIYEIKSYYYLKIKRWDIILKNNKTIKLPSKDYDQSLKNFMSFKNKKNFEKYNNFDYRIKNQLILNK